MANKFPAGLNSTWRISILVPFTLLVALAGWVYSSEHHRTFEEELRLRLREAAEMKARGISAWLRERLADARVSAVDVALLPSVRRLVTGTGSREDSKDALLWLETIRTQYRYENVALFRNDGVALLTAGENPGGGPYCTTVETLTSEEFSTPRLSGPARAGGNGQPCLSITIAIPSPSGARFANLVLGIDPEHDLYPALRQWPGSGSSGDIFLLRKNGSDVEFLNETHLAGKSVLFRKRPLSESSLPAAKAVLGATVADGVDFRGVPVHAAAVAVPGTDWFVLAKVDGEEAFAPLRREDIFEVAFLGTVVLLIFLAGGLLEYRHRERQLAEKQIQDAERLALLGSYDFLSRFANDAILVWQDQGLILEANERARQMFGFEEAEMTGRLVSELALNQPPESFENSAVFETTYHRADGTAFPAEVSLRRTEVSGKVLYQSIIRDISERRQAERQIHRLNRLYAVFSACSSASCRMRNEDDLFREVCRVVVECGGFPLGWVGRLDSLSLRVFPVAVAGSKSSYMTGVTIAVDSSPWGSGPTGLCVREGRPVACTDFETDPMMLPWRERARKEGLRSSISVPLVRRGRTGFVLGMYSSEPFFFTGEEISLVDEVADIVSFALDRMSLEAERDQEELQRKVTQERLELALDAASEGFCDLRLDGTGSYASPRFFSMLGYEPNECRITPEFLIRITHPDDRPLFQLKFGAILDGTVSESSAEFRAAKKDGSYIWVQGRTKTVSRDDTGKPTRIVNTRAEISSRKLLEQEFLQAQKMESIGRMAGGVAHDFNNHLTVINGYSSMVLRRLPADSPLARPLREIQNAGERAAGLTRQLLAFSRKDVEHKEPLNVNEVIQTLQKMFLHLMGEHIQLDLHLDSAAPAVLADKIRIEQIVMNLVVNARDSIHDHGRVAVRTENVYLDPLTRPDKAGRYLLLTVQDTGCGMAPGVKEKIFEPFFTTKDKFRGTGLGLSTVYGIVQDCGGWIEVQSAPGQGSAFQIYLPAFSDCLAKGPETKAEAGLAYGAGTILIVEDQPGVREMAVEFVGQLGYKVLSAPDAEKAIQVSREYPDKIDAVISDVVMPGMNGPEMVHEILQRRPGMKVLYVSGYAGDTFRLARLKDSGAVFLPKPYTPDILSRAVRALLQPQGKS